MRRSALSDIKCEAQAEAQARLQITTHVYEFIGELIFKINVV